MRMISRRCLLGLVTTVLLAMVATVAITAFPVAADEQPVVELNPGDTRTIISDSPKAAVAGTGLILFPEDCAAPPTSAECDVYPIKLNRDPSEEAVNFVVVRLSWDGVQAIPPISAVAVGIGFGDAVQYDTYLFTKDAEGDSVRVADFSPGLGNPEVLGFLADQDEYWLTVQASQGASLGYQLELAFSSERFDAPFEILDPAFAGGTGGGGDDTSPTDFSDDERPAAFLPFEDTPPAGGDIGFDGFLAPSDPSLSPNLAPVEPDADFRGFGGGIDDGLVGDLATFTPPADVAPVAAAKPGAGSVVFWLLLVPVGFAVLMFVALRRRRPPALAG